MGTRYEIVSMAPPKEPGGRSFYTRIGTGFENDDGSFMLKFDALPLGTSKVYMRIPMTQGERQQRYESTHDAPQGQRRQAPPQQRQQPAQQPRQQNVYRGAPKNAPDPTADWGAGGAGPAEPVYVPEGGDGFADEG